MNKYLSWQFGSLVAAGLVFFPIVALLVLAFTGTDASLAAEGSVWEHLWQTVLIDYVSGSLQLMAGVALLTLLLGIGSAWLVTQYEFVGVRFFSWALLLPLAMPTYITAYSYTGLLDVAGPIQSAIRSNFDLSFGEYWFPEIRSMSGAIFVMSFVLYPYVYLLARASFLEQSRNLKDAARLLGYSRKQAFLKITLPIARPAIIAGLSVALMETLADYGAVSYFGVSTFTTGIFRTWYGLDSITNAAQLALALLTFIIILVVVEKNSRRRIRYHSKKSNQTTAPKKITSKKAVLAFCLCSIPLLLGFIIPVSQLLVWATQSYQQLADPAFWQLVKNTLLLASVTAALALILALLIAYSDRIIANKLTKICKNIAALGYAVPGTVIAVGILIPLARLDNTVDAWFRANFDFSTGLLISGTIAALILAYLVRFLAIALNTVDSGLSGISNNMDQASRSLGITPIQTLRKVHIPILKGSLFTALLLVFVDVMKELPATLILRPFNFNTLAVRAYELATDERLVDASLPAIAIVLAGLLPIIFITKAINK